MKEQQKQPQHVPSALHTARTHTYTCRLHNLVHNIGQTVLHIPCTTFQIFTFIIPSSKCIGWLRISSHVRCVCECVLIDQPIFTQIHRFSGSRCAASLKILNSLLKFYVVQSKQLLCVRTIQVWYATQVHITMKFENEFGLVGFPPRCVDLSWGF